MLLCVFWVLMNWMMMWVILWWVVFFLMGFLWCLVMRMCSILWIWWWRLKIGLSCCTLSERCCLMKLSLWLGLRIWDWWKIESDMGLKMRVGWVWMKRWRCLRWLNEGKRRRMRERCRRFWKSLGIGWDWMWWWIKVWMLVFWGMKKLWCDWWVLRCWICGGFEWKRWRRKRRRVRFLVFCCCIWWAWCWFLLLFLWLVLCLLICYNRLILWCLLI